MFNDALKEITGLLDRRFLLNIFFPCLLFCGLLMVVCILGAGGDLVAIATAWTQQDTGIKILQIVGFLSIVTVCSGIVDSQIPTIIRFYEGYPPLDRRLAKLGRRFHQNRLVRLNQKAKENYSYLQAHYPRYVQDSEQRQAMLDQVMPTQFGNILKNSERYPGDRYGLDAVVIWPRLYPLFPDRFIQIVAEAKSAVDFLLVISTLSGLFALVTGIYLLLVKAVWWLFLLCFWGGLAIAWFAYRGALVSALSYAQQIKTGFDLYRQELFKQMHLKYPPNLEAEEQQWRQVNKFLYQNELRLPDYANSEASNSDSSKQQNSP